MKFLPIKLNLIKITKVKPYCYRADHLTHLIGQELWVMGADKNEANHKAVELLENLGFPKNTSYDLVKVKWKYNVKVYNANLLCIG